VPNTEPDGFWVRTKEWWSLRGGRGYRDVWLLIITGLVLVALSADSNRTDAIQQSRAESTLNNCRSFNEGFSNVNLVLVALTGIVLAGAALPGDEPIPASSDPTMWESIKEGPLSKQIQGVAPNFPSSTERLLRAQDNASALQALKVEMRNCTEAVQKVYAEGG
jgi:hypothetical protein